MKTAEQRIIEFKFFIEEAIPGDVCANDDQEECSSSLHEQVEEMKTLITECYLNQSYSEIVQVIAR